MRKTIFQSLVDAGLTAETEPGYDCGDCYGRDASTCRPVLVPVKGEVQMCVYPCGRVEVIGGEDNLCLAAGRLTFARLFNCFV
jgi:hypothetical protein